MPSKSELMQAMTAALDRFNQAVAGLDKTALEGQAVCGVWSARDVAGHLADWNTELLAAAEHGLAGERAAGQPIEDGEAFNTDHASARKSQSWAQAKADLDASVDRVKTVIAGIDEAKLSQTAGYPWGGEGTIADILDAIPGHMDEHTEGVEAALKG